MDGNKFGQAFARRFGADDATTIVARALRMTEIPVTYLHHRSPTGQLSEPQPVEDSYLLSICMRDFTDYQLWEGGRPVRTQPVFATQITLHDLRAEPYILVNNEMISLHFHLSRATFNALADQAGVPRISDLAYPHGRGVHDPTINHLGMALMPAIAQPEQANQLFIDHVTQAISAHIAWAYGSMRSVIPHRGGLAPWQQKIATDLLDDSLDGEISHARLARECKLSPSHFAHAFRVSMGMPPHRWLLHRRVDKAKALLRETRIPLAMIAASCGFAHQAHFTRVFKQAVGETPGAWQRRRAE